jgi:hypothetical protein
MRDARGSEARRVGEEERGGGEEAAWHETGKMELARGARI